MSFASIQALKDKLEGNAGETAECAFEVLNSTDGTVRIGVEAVVQRGGKPLQDSDTRAIARIKGDNEIELKANEQDKVVVSVTVPEPSSDGDYTLELRVYDVRETETTVTSPVVAIEPAEAVVEKKDEEPAKKTPWGLIIGGIVGGLVLLIGGGFGIYKLMSSSSDAIPNVVNLTSEDATDILTEANLTALINEEVTGNADPGIILSQVPAAGEDVPEDSTVTLVMEAASASLPNLLGLTVPAAEAKLLEAGFEPGLKTFDQSGQYPGGAVTAQNPAPGDRALPGQTVDLTIEKEMVRVPKLAGMDYAAAKSVLLNVGLTARSKTGKGSGTPGTVIAQSPDVDASVDRGSAVLVTIKQKTVKMPNLRGRSVDSATVALTRLGLQVSGVKTQRSKNANEVNKVVGQRPGAGKDLYTGGAVQLIVARKYTKPTSKIDWVVGGGVNIATLRTDTCKKAVNGKIAWDYKGSKSWSPTNVARLCKGAEGSTEPAKCFHTVLHRGVNYGGGTKWQWGNAINLCSGATNSSKRVNCFKNKIQSGSNWQNAIKACNTTLYKPRAIFTRNIAAGS